MNKKLIIVAFSFFLAPTVVNAFIPTNTILCASGFGDSATNGTYTYYDEVNGYHVFTNGTRFFSSSGSLDNQRMENSAIPGADVNYYWPDDGSTAYPWVSDPQSYILDAGTNNTAPGGITKNGKCPDPFYQNTYVPTVFTLSFTQLGEILLFTLVPIIATLIALMGLGYGLMKLRKYITGKKY